MAKCKKPKGHPEFPLFSANDAKSHLKLLSEGVSLQVIHERHPEFFNIPYPKDENGTRVITYRESLLTLISFGITNYLECTNTMDDEYFTQMFKSLYCRSTGGGTRRAKNALAQEILDVAWGVAKENLTLNKRMVPFEGQMQWFKYYTDFINNKILALII